MHQISLSLRWIISIALLIPIACEKPNNSDPANKDGNTNTLNEGSVGNGAEGQVQDYFYDFGSDISADFYRFGNTRFDFTYQQYRDLFHQDPYQLNFRTFPEYLLEITPDSVGSNLTERVKIDSLTQDNYVTEDSLTIVSTQFKDINSLVWQTDATPDLQRYKINKSGWVYSDTSFLYKDTLNWLVYAAVQDTINLSGATFVDKSEWVDTTYYPDSPRQKIYSKTFHFVKKILSSDSLVYRIDTDCNQNGQWDTAETEDQGNGIWDPEEPYYDINENGSYDLSEPYRDCNCDGVHEGAEAFDDTSGNGIYDLGEPFTDLGNGKIDPAEAFTDLNGDGTPGSNELFIFDEKPNKLLVSYDNYPDLNSYRVLTTILPGDSLVDRWGHVYHDIIKLIQTSEVVTKPVDDLDSLVTLYTNRVIDHLSNIPDLSDLFITKTEWYGVDASTSTPYRDYDYLLFKQADNIYQLVHPSYFKPPGYQGFDATSWSSGSWSSDFFESGFWFEKHPVEEILYYTSNGMLRDGERVETDTAVVTSVATYTIHNSFAVDADEVTVPAKTVIGYINNQGEKTCYADTSMSVSDYSECPSTDTTFTDCFLITREMTMTMAGNGVEYGERDLTWLVKGYGIVKDEVYVRWGEAAGMDPQWFGYSKWVLKDYSSTSNAGRIQLGRLAAPAHLVKSSDFQNESDMGNDPYKITRTSGLQRISESKDE